jgi:DNA-binding CsgD family transcriptional regulator
MLNQAQHDDIVAQIYAAALGQLPWPIFMERLSGQFGSTASVCQISDSGHHLLLQQNHGYSTEFAAEFYTSEAYARDPRPAHFWQVELGTVYHDRSLYDVDKIYRDPRVLESCELLGVTYQFGTLVSMPNGQVGALALLRTAKEGMAEQEAVAALQRLVPHIEQALSIGHVLNFGAAREASLLDALTHKADGIIILSRLGLPTYMNEAAERMLAARDGLYLTDEGMAAARGPETRRLRGMVAAALEAWASVPKSPGGQMLVSRPSGLRGYIVRVMPQPPGDAFLLGGGAACVIHLHDLAAVRLPSEESLIAIFGLSKREADLAIELVRCTGLAAAAANAGMAPNTARNHLQSIFRKCGINSQTEAVQLFGHLL